MTYDMKDGIIDEIDESRRLICLLYRQYQEAVARARPSDTKPRKSKRLRAEVVRVLRYTPRPTVGRIKTPIIISPILETHPGFPDSYDYLQPATAFEEHEEHALRTLLELYESLDECLDTLDRTERSFPECVYIKNDEVRMEVHSYLSRRQLRPKTRRGWHIDF